MQNRFHRQVILKDFGNEGQQKLFDSKVLVVGAGGLGVPVLAYLNAMGVGTLGIVDNDNVALTNLQRQVLYTEKDINTLKVDAAAKKLKAQNSDTHIISHKTLINRENALKIIDPYDVVVDCSDNFPTRYLINDACVILNKPFVYGALHGFEGQVSVFNHKKGPTYRCLFPNMPKAGEVPDCNENGVLGVVPGIIGNFQALETVKVLTGVGECLSGELLVFDGLRNNFQKMRFLADQENKNRKELEERYGFHRETASDFSNIILVRSLMADGLVELLDVRTPAEYSYFSITGAKNIPLDELRERHAEIDLDKTVYVVCQSGMRSKKAIGILESVYPEKKFTDVPGGINTLDPHGHTD